MRYKDLTPETKNTISKLVLDDRRINASQILHAVFGIKKDFKYSKFFLIGTNEITKNERLIGQFCALNTPNGDDWIVLFESMLFDSIQYSGFVECIAIDDRSEELNAMIIHPFNSNITFQIRLVQSGIETFPMAIINYNTLTRESIVIDYMTKEHWVLLEKRFHNFINVLI